MNIILTDEEKAYLKQYAANYEKDRQLDATRDPIIVVENRTPIAVDSDYGYDKIRYRLYIDDYDCSEDGTFEDINDLNEYLKNNLSFKDYPSDDGDEDDFHTAVDDCLDRIRTHFYIFSDECEYIDATFNFKINIVPLYVKYIYKPVAYFFSRKEAEKYCQYQHHNLDHPRVYARYSGYNNRGDFPVLSKLLLKMGEQLNASIKD